MTTTYETEIFSILGTKMTLVQSRALGKCGSRRHSTTSVSENKTFSPVYTGPDKFVNGRIFYLCKPFTRSRANSVTDRSTVCHSKTCTVPRRGSRVNEWRIGVSFCPFNQGCD